MNHLLRLAALTVFLLGLPGCNIVVSKDPWFTAADAAPTPVMRDGLWLSAKPDCRFDEARPAERWPDCADSFFVRGEERWSMRWDEVDARGRQRRTFAGWESDDSGLSGGLFVANGDHLIAQMETGGEPDPALTDEVEPGDEDAQPGYMYGAMRPVRHDGEGKITATEFWLVQCGPLPEPKRSEKSRSRSPSRRDEAEPATPNVTDRPFPGLTVTDDVCFAESAEAVRRAAELSETLGEKSTSRWIRDGWR